ncbi:FKBP-type peptidyl-prolyl cis-trans isomerase [Aliikangiella coralliicola]|uniref:Peptidyl-prolyl cis-trans isomerase n=1 Tax=Aliikangiella coralliicola TaxID=2592383 RepID=A0A545TV04_9GAMM|nr:FKBP-type peptidyl-prolyl cis-trans isomerase [Aliikangiella coralliicola]TQV81047.1 FKBP-type peptidyl-prolyl cis-trans isomerase [Aliikangiella coralliicola]
MSNKYDSHELKASYGIGRNMGTQLFEQPFDGIDIDAVVDGLVDAFKRQPSPVSQQEMDAAFQHISQIIQAKQAEQSKGIIEEGEKFLAENATKDGVTVTESGLQYEVINEGSGEKPSATSTVRTHYHGTLIDGTVFDSSYERGQPAEFAVNGVIPGWTEALQMMTVGSKWKLSIPYQLAYGERGAGAAIGPYSTLVFDVELLEIVG